MTNLIHELNRLFFLPGQEVAISPRLSASLAGDGTTSLPLLNPQQGVRTLVVDVARVADWNAVSALYHGVQEDLALPAPAISISPKAGFQVWFSLSGPIPQVQAERFLEALRLRYLADLPATKVTLHPSCDYPNAEIVLVPACHQETGHWSAFIDPTLVSMFADEPGLEMAPNLARQADMLASIKSIKGGDVQRVMALLQEAWGTIGLTRQPEYPANHRDTTPCTDSAQPRVLTVGSDFSDPKSFLLAVMNDPTANAQDRIRAAKALLPYFEQAHQT